MRDAAAGTTARPLQAAEVAGQAGLLAFALAQEEELGATHNAATLDRDIRDARAVQRERTLDTFTSNNAANLDGAADAAAVERDDGAREQLHAFLIAFLDQVVHVDGVADPEVGERGFHVLEFELALERARTDQAVALSRLERLAGRPLETLDERSEQEDAR